MRVSILIAALYVAVGAGCLVYLKLLDMPASRRLQLAAEAAGELEILGTSSGSSGAALGSPHSLANKRRVRNRHRAL